MEEKVGSSSVVIDGIMGSGPRPVDPWWKNQISGGFTKFDRLRCDGGDGTERQRRFRSYFYDRNWKEPVNWFWAVKGTLGLLNDTGDEILNPYIVWNKRTRRGHKGEHRRGLTGSGFSPVLFCELSITIGTFLSWVVYLPLSGWHTRSTRLWTITEGPCNVHVSDSRFLCDVPFLMIWRQCLLF